MQTHWRSRVYVLASTLVLAIGCSSQGDTDGGSSGQGGVHSGGDADKTEPTAGNDPAAAAASGLTDRAGANAQGGLSDQAGAGTQGGVNNQSDGGYQAGAHDQGGSRNQGGVSNLAGATNHGGATNLAGATNQGGATNLAGATNLGGADNQAGATNLGGADNQAGAANRGGGNGGVSTCVPHVTGCDSNSDCVKGSYCVNWQCQLGSALGDPCIAGCQQGLVCTYAGVCVVPGPYCNSQPCAEGANCEVVYDMASPDGGPFCGVACNMCLPPAGWPGRCASNTKCGPLMYCAASLSYVCASRLAEGSACALESNGQDPCLQGLFCYADEFVLPSFCPGFAPPVCDYVAHSHCHPLPAEGEACVGQCVDNLVCDVTSALCRQPASGDPCYSRECPDGLYCDSGNHCRDRLASGVACAPGQCQSGLYCPGQSSMTSSQAEL